MAKEAEKKEEVEDVATAEEGVEGEAPAEDSKDNKKKMLIIGGGVVLLLILVGAGLFFSGVLGGGKSHDEEATAGGHGSSEGGTAAVSQPVYFDLPELLVNLNTGGKQASFIKATITLELMSKEDEPIVQANLPRLMDSYNTFLREMRANDLYGSAGMYRLREEMLSRANTILAPAKVKDVLFRQLLVQ